MVWAWVLVSYSAARLRIITLVVDYPNLLSSKVVSVVLNYPDALAKTLRRSYVRKGNTRHKLGRDQKTPGSSPCPMSENTSNFPLRRVGCSRESVTMKRLWREPVELSLPNTTPRSFPSLPSSSTQ